MLDRVVLLGAETPGGRGIAKKLRAEHYQCMLLPSGARAQQVRALDVSGIVLIAQASEGGQGPDPDLLSLGLPLLAMGDAAIALLDGVATAQNMQVQETLLPIRYLESPLFGGMIASERWVARARGYAVEAPYRVLAESGGYPLVVGDEARHTYLMQFQLERNDPEGTAMLAAFAGQICGCTPWWTPEAMLRGAAERVAKAVGQGQAICAMSGGLDSTVAALVAREAVGDRIQYVYVDTGLLREGEAEATEALLTQQLGLMLHRVDVSERILGGLKGLTDRDDKWAVIDGCIGGALAEVAAGIGGPCTLVKGTNYMDALPGPAHPPQAGDLPVVAPLDDLYKDDIRVLGRMLSLPDVMRDRQSFPGMGLAARIQGEVTQRRLDTLRRADAIYTSILDEAGQAKRLDRYFALLDERDGHCTVILRALQGAEPRMNVARLPYDLLERTVEQVRQAVPCVERVLYDMTPGMAEWSQ